MKERKLSSAQLRMLRSTRDFADPFNHVHGQAAHGGGAGTLASLIRRKLVEYPTKPGAQWKLTKAGDRALRDDAVAELRDRADTVAKWGASLKPKRRSRR